MTYTVASHHHCALLITADDRTGALEVGGALANAQFPIPVGPHAESDICCVVDIGSRHLDPEAAARHIIRVHGRDARYRCHKMDSGLRGNWPYEAQAFVDLGYPVAIVPSFPDAGRRCHNGVVYVNDVPTLDSPFGQDPLTAPISSRPLEVLEASGCAGEAVVVWDANDNVELRAAVQRCRQEERVLIGPTGAVAAYAATVFPDISPGSPFRRVPRPVLVVCGSLNAMSRDQLDRLGCPIHSPQDDLPQTQDVIVMATNQPTGPISNDDATRVAATVAEVALATAASTTFPGGTLFVIGGDTAAAMVGDETLEVIGCVDTGIPISRFRDGHLVTKGGGIGSPDTLVKLLGNV